MVVLSKVFMGVKKLTTTSKIKEASTSMQRGGMVKKWQHEGADAANITMIYTHDGIGCPLKEA